MSQLVYDDIIAYINRDRSTYKPWPTRSTIFHLQAPNGHALCGGPMLFSWELVNCPDCWTKLKESKMDDNRPLHYEPFMQHQDVKDLIPDANTTKVPAEVTCNQCIIGMRGVEVPNV